MAYMKFAFKGIERIEIPRKDSDFSADNGYGAEIIKRYLPSVLSQHQANAQKIDYFYKYYLGEQDILEKKRLYEKDCDNNHIVVENHAKRQVDFSTGFITSEKREYTYKFETKGKELSYLDRYFIDSNFFEKDKRLKEWVFISGVGIVYASPRTDIITTVGVDEITKTPIVDYETKSDWFDIEYNAPFVIDTIDPRFNFVVYSSGFDKTPLFCVSIVDIDVTEEGSKSPKIHSEIHIETRYAHFKIESNKSYKTFYPNGIDSLSAPSPKALKYLPMIECSVNSAREGIIEINRDIFNQINDLKSNVADMIVDNANPIMVFMNADVDKEDAQNVRKAGCVVLSDQANAGSGAKADLKVITTEIPFEGLNNYYEQLITPAYDIAGVPLASGQISSGGSNNQAVVVGSGLTNSSIVAKNNITSFMKFDYELLGLLLYFCKQIPNCPISALNPSQVDIKYNIDISENFQAKAQGMMYMYNMNMPKKAILKSSGLFNDITTLDTEWEENDAKAKESKQAVELAKQSADKNIASGEQNADTTQEQDNNSQE